MVVTWTYWTYDPSVLGKALLKQFGLSGALLPRYIRGPADLHGEMWGLRQGTQLTYILKQHLPYTCQFNAIFLTLEASMQSIVI